MYRAEFWSFLCAFRKLREEHAIREKQYNGNAKQFNDSERRSVCGQIVNSRSFLHIFGFPSHFSIYLRPEILRFPGGDTSIFGRRY